MESKIAGKLYKIFKQTDPGLAFLEASNILKDCNIQKVTEYYKDLQGGKLKLAEVITASALTTDQASKIEKKLIKTFGADLIVIFEQDENVLGGLVIKVGDNVIDESLKTKIHNIKI